MYDEIINYSGRDCIGSMKENSIVGYKHSLVMQAILLDMMVGFQII